MVVYGVNMFGDALRDLLDPRLRGARALGGRVSDEERRATYETASAEGAYAFLGSFSDITRDLRVNNTASEFIHSKIRVDGPLRVPDQRRPRVRTVWQIDAGGSAPRLITAYPLEADQ